MPNKQACFVKIQASVHFPFKQPNSKKLSVIYMIISVVKEFGDEGTKRLLGDIEKIQKQIKEAKGVLAVWKEQGLSKSEIRALEILFARGNNKMKQICHTLQAKKQLLESISQPQIQLIKSLDQWTLMQRTKKPYKDYSEYQQINGKAIDTLYAQLRVREVHFRTKKLASSGSNYKAGEELIQVVSGFNSKTDEEVEVIKIPKNMTNFEKLNRQLVTFNALRDLSLSPYFPRFLGYNTTSDPTHYLYFRQHLPTTNLQHLLKNSSTILQQEYIIFKYWAGELYRALADIHIQCSYLPVLPIQLGDVEVGDYGLRVVVKHAKFVAEREIGEGDDIEAGLLENLGRLLLEMLKITQDQIQPKIKHLQNRSLLHTLLKSKDGLQKYQKNIVPCYINFFNVQTHPLFQCIQETQALQIIDNFTILFGDQV